MELKCPQCGRGFTPKRSHAVCCSDPCRYQHWIEREVEAARQRVESHALVEVRALQEEGGASADYLILAREQIARTLLHTGWFTADDLEPLGIPQQYRRSVHGSATGHFSGEQPYMEEAGRRKSERPTRKGGKSTVFRITVKGRRELPGLLKGMAGPVAEANKRLYGESSTQTGKGPAPKHDNATLDRPALPQSTSPSGARRNDAVKGERDSSAGSSLPAEEPAAQLFEIDPPSAYDPYSEAA